VKLAEPSPAGTPLNKRLATSGFRFTRQRQHVYDVLLEWRDHPSADEVFQRAKGALPEISCGTGNPWRLPGVRREETKMILR
jgi:hypothetical protein